MNKYRCLDCLFVENCSYQNRLECNEYYLLRECCTDSTSDTDEMLDEYIESRRKEFYAEWFDYIRDVYE